MSDYDNTNSGALFANEKRRTDNSPTHTGQCEVVCPACGAVTETWISAWVKVARSGKKFFSLAFRPKDETAAPSTPAQQDGDDFDDDIPF